jgi:hypothetical protein
MQKYLEAREKGRVFGSHGRDQKKLREQLVMKNEATFNGVFLWLCNERICVRCWDDSDSQNRKVSRLLKDYTMKNGKIIDGVYSCRICKSHFTTEEAHRQLID